MERLLMHGVEMPDREARKDTLWRRLHEIRDDFEVVRRLLLRQVAHGMVSNQHPLHSAAENLFNELERIDPDWRRRLLGQDAPGPVHEAFDRLHNEVHALLGKTP
jgi:hypothetical protein